MAFTSKKFAPGAPNPKVARFTTGKASPDYDFMLRLISDGRVQIRHNALEAARVAANKKLALIGEDGYHLLVKTYPHIILRENKMIATAGADRLQEGMRKAFGKPIGLAARVEIGSTVLELSVKSENLDKGK
jgi:large subunit ribosomal protein L10e